MHAAIEEIIKNTFLPNELKIKKLNSLLGEIGFAKRVISGEFKYCPDCGDYYLSKSFLNDTVTEDTKICVYTDPINSGGNEYKDGIVKIKYCTCPKGHRKEIDREEFMK